MTQIKEMAYLVCAKCSQTFQPKPGGWNAKYCSRACKDRVKHSKRPSRAGQETHYSKVIKSDPEKLKLHRERANKGRTQTRQWLADYKMSKGCQECGYRQHFSALQLHHTGNKSISISEARSSTARLIKEIEDGECVVLCANCHSIKSWEQRTGETFNG
jgi:hypothetical protein